MAPNNIFNQPFGVTWRKALLSAPRLVPDVALYLTSASGPQPIVFEIPSRGKHKIPIYVFIPPSPKLSIANEISKLPVLFDFHGGGFIYGSCQEQAPFCAKLCRELNAVSISIDYRLGPAAQFPAANEDAEDVVNAVLDPTKPGYDELRAGIDQFLKKEKRPKIDLDKARIATSGFSSGGNLALNLALNVKIEDSSAGRVEKDWPSVFPATFKRDIPLLLFFPSLDCRQLPSERPRPAAMGEVAPKGFFKSLDLESQLMPTYLPRNMAGHPRASPGLAKIKDGGLHEKAKVFFVLPEMDTLASQSDAWIEKVKVEGRIADLSVERVRGVVHGWTQFPDSWLTDTHRRLKLEVFNKARDFVAKVWEVDTKSVAVSKP
jgi:acetyl esterase/lipase